MDERATRAACAERAVRALLRESLAASFLAEAPLRVVTGGLSNRAWRADTARGSWFVRLGDPEVAALGVDREAECRLASLASAAGLAPELLACEPSRGLLVTRFVEAAAWSFDDARNDRNLRRIGALLGRLHALDPPDGLRRVSLLRQASQLAARCPAAPSNDDLATEAGRRMARLAELTPRDCVCHHDLHHLNVLDDGSRLWLVDWEYGGRADPLFELAGFAAMHTLDPGRCSVLIEAYGALPGRRRELFDDARWLFDYVQWLWYRLRAGQGDAGDGCAIQVERLERRLRTGAAHGG